MNKTRPFLHISLLIKYSDQQQIHFNGNIFRNKYCRCNEGSLYKEDNFCNAASFSCKPILQKVATKETWRIVFPDSVYLVRTFKIKSGLWFQNNDVKD